MWDVWQGALIVYAFVLETSMQRSDAGVSGAIAEYGGMEFGYTEFAWLPSKLKNGTRCRAAKVPSPEWESRAIPILIQSTEIHRAVSEKECLCRCWIAF